MLTVCAAVANAAGFVGQQPARKGVNDLPRLIRLFLTEALADLKAASTEEKKAQLAAQVEQLQAWMDAANNAVNAKREAAAAAAAAAP